MPKKFNERIALILSPPFWPNLPPLSLISLGSYLIRNGKDVELFDLNNLFFNLGGRDLTKTWLISCNTFFEDKMFEILRKNFASQLNQQINHICEYEVIGFSCYRSNLKTTQNIAQLIKQKRKDVKIVFGGPEIARLHFKTRGNFFPEFQGIVDLLVAGEGEKPLLKFVKGEITDKVALFCELDDLDESNWIEGYKKIDCNVYPKKQAISLFFSRGCVRRCRFCSERLLYKKFRRRGIENLLNEIAFHRENGIKNFVFHDSMLNAEPAALEKFCEALIKQFGKINWEAQMAVRTDMTDILLAKIKQSGCYNIFIGLESGCEKTLKKMNKGFSAGEAKNFFQQLKKANLSFGVSIIVGFPGETEDDCEESLRFLIENKEWILKIEQINPFVYYEGTDTGKSEDYRQNAKILERTEHFVERLKEHSFKMTRAFVNNLVEKQC